MADRQLTTLLTQLKSNPSSNFTETSSLLSRAKLLLLQLNALTPATTTDPSLLALARDTYEQGALASIRAKNPESFTRYVSQLQPFYELSGGSDGSGERNKVTGLYLLLLLTQGRYAEFHSELEALSTNGVVDVEADRYLGYPIRLERWLMEGSYDRVWKAMKKGEVPCEEFGVFSEVCLTFLLGLLMEGSMLMTTTTTTDPDLPDPLRDRLLQRARIPVAAAVVDQVAALPRVGGRRGRVCAQPRLDGQGRPDLLPVGPGRGRRGRAGQGDEPDGD